MATLRTVFLRHWRAAFTAAYEAATQEPTGDGAAGGNASEDLPRAQGGQCVTPPASTQGPGVPSAPSVPFQDGAFTRPERDSTPVPWDLDPESFAAVDALDSMAEGLVLTPGHDPYASPDGGSPKTPVASANGAGENDDRQPRGRPSGPSMARKIFGGRQRGTPRTTSAMSGEETHREPEGRDTAVPDGMDIETASDDGGPWLRARVRKRRPKDRSPQGTPRQGAQGRPNLGPTPMKVRELPSAPNGARASRGPDNAHARGPPGRANPSSGNVASGSTAQGNAESHATVEDPSAMGARSPLRSRSVSPNVGRGAPSTNTELPARPETMAEDGDEMCGAYARLTNNCWARLVRLSERPSERELLALQEKSLQALIKAVGRTYGGDWRKPEFAQVLMQWMEEHPDQPLPLPLGRLREPRRRHSRPESDPPPRKPSDAHRERGDGGAPRRSTPPAAATGTGARTDGAGDHRQSQDDAPMTDAAGHGPTANARASVPFPEQEDREPASRPFGRARSPHQAAAAAAAAALRESSRALMATLDAVAHLFELARRGEECPEEEGERIAAMVEDSRKTLSGVVAGFAAADLLAALTPAPETEQRPSATNRAGGTGGRTYAQAARTGPPPPENRPGPPHQQAPPAPWAPERTALLHPAEDRQRQAPTRASEFGAELDRVLRSDLELAQGPAVELVRRTAKGEYAVQFGAPAWARLQDDRTITLPSFGRWFRRVADPARRQRNSVVLQGVPKSMTPDQVVRDLLSGNGERWKDLNAPDLDDVRVERLNR